MASNLYTVKLLLSRYLHWDATQKQRVKGEEGARTRMNRRGRAGEGERMRARE